MLTSIPAAAFDFFQWVALFFFVGINAIRRKDINPAIETKIHMVGIMVLLMVLVVVTFKDIKHIWFTKMG